MLTVAYLANEFPSAVEPYVSSEVEELRRRGVRVVTGSVWRGKSDSSIQGEPEVVVMRSGTNIMISAAWLCIAEWRRIATPIGRVLFRGRESPIQRLKALAHTFLGACYAVRLRDRGVDHIHVHHGYFGSWVAMTAAQLLGVPYSVTLHGSDLLLHGAYLDVKLANSSFCLTISEYNRRYILEHYPEVEAGKVIVGRLGVGVPDSVTIPAPRTRTTSGPLTLLAVGRLHAVKDHAFLVRACARLATREAHFECVIAGEGPERSSLQSLIRRSGLERRVTLLGHVPREQMDSLYDRADVVVLTSRSEGIPLVLMEAMARGKIVVAPAITGIPELVIGGKTGFLYEPGSIHDLVDCLLLIDAMMLSENRRGDQRPDQATAATPLDWIRHAARVQVRHNFNRKTNLECFADLFVQRIVRQSKSIPDENLVLQQI
ncbi:MAG TPA: glycosyltransferase family 4 protein [Candidatus Dormibacteraeota bacterium]|nr:glycosyltransferase family 4 protein [Candidatus Dormibacteraeota bacterium]